MTTSGGTYSAFDYTMDKTCRLGRVKDRAYIKDVVHAEGIDAYVDIDDLGTENKITQYIGGVTNVQ